jgi:anti-sigma B factor antagonist
VVGAQGVVSQPSVAVLKVSGELEIGRRWEIREALRLTGTERAVLVDFSDVTYADSTALSELVRLHREAEAQHTRMAVLIGNAQFGRLIQYAGLSQVFAVFDERGRALAFLEEQDRP